MRITTKIRRMRDQYVISPKLSISKTTPVPSVNCAFKKKEEIEFLKFFSSWAYLQRLHNDFPNEWREKWRKSNKVESPGNNESSRNSTPFPKKRSSKGVAINNVNYPLLKSILDDAYPLFRCWVWYLKLMVGLWCPIAQSRHWHDLSSLLNVPCRWRRVFQRV